MPSLITITDSPYVWRVAPSEVETVRALLPSLRHIGTGQSSMAVIEESLDYVVYRLPSIRPGVNMTAKLCKQSGWDSWFKSSPGAHEARIMKKLRRAGLQVPDFVAMGTKRVLPFELENVLAVRSPADFVSFGRWSYNQFQEHYDEARKRVSPALTKILASIRRMHEAGVSHGDMHPGNILVNSDGTRFVFTGFHHSRPVWPQPFRRRARDVCELLAFYDDYYGRNELFDLARAYSRGSMARKICDRWDDIIEQIRKQCADSVVKECLRSGTYFRRLDKETETVVFDRQYDVEEIHSWRHGQDTPKEWDIEELPGDRQTVQRRWQEAIREAMYIEKVGCPVALIRRSGSEAKSVLIWDPARKPKYLLDEVFSLKRFSAREEDSLSA